ALLYRDAPGVTTSRAALRFIPHLSAQEWALVLAAGVAFALFNVGFIVLVGFGPGVLVSRGATLARAGSLVSLAVWVSAISVPLGGAVVDRWRRQDLAIATGCLLTALAIAAMPLVPPPVVWLLVTGIVVGPVPGALVALVPRSVKPEQFAPAFGVFYATYYLGMAALQPAAGLL